MNPEDSAALLRAVRQIEHPGFGARLAAYSSQPLDAAMRYLPSGVHRRIRDVVQVVILNCLKIAIGSLGKQKFGRWSNLYAKTIVGLSGGVGGFFGLYGLPFELPVTTTLMLRSIADIARHAGEDLSKVESLLACLEVFALGARDSRTQAHEDYYALRVVLTQLSGEMAALMLERGAVSASAPVVAKIVGEIAGRFGLVVADMSASTMVPVLGAVGGAAINILFMDHFQQVAEGHFTVRRLERRYGFEQVKQHYDEYRRQLPSP